MTLRARALFAVLLTVAILPVSARGDGNIVANAQKPLPLMRHVDASTAAKRFVQHVNYARVALAMKNGPLAHDHIVQARGMLRQLRKSAPAKRELTASSGHVVYNYNTAHKDHYYPIETGPMELETLDKAPFWTSKNTLAVTDADIVYVTLDVRNNRTERYLRVADHNIGEGKLVGADNQLAALTNEVIHVSNKKPLSHDVAEDNIALAHSFLTAGNYDGARFALKHADSALENLEIDSAYKTHRPAIIAMRQQVSDMQNTIRRNDPSLLEKTSLRMEGWRQDIKSWASN